MAGVIRAVLFDLDNTLADREQAFTTWAAHFARSRLGISDPNEIEAFVTKLTDLDANGRTPKHDMFQTLKDRYPILTDECDALTSAFQDDILANLPPLNHNAARLIGVLDRALMPWGIVSNGSRNQLRKIAKLGLGDRASCILLSEVVGNRKPDPVIFRLAAEHLGLAPESVLFVGDHPVADIAGAAAHGGNQQQTKE